MRRYMVTLAVLLAIGCGERLVPSGPQTDDFRSNGVLRVESYHKSPLAYPDFGAPSGRWDGSFSDDCAGLSAEPAFACAEQLYWQAFQIAPETRGRTHEILGQRLAEWDRDAAIEDPWLAVLYWRRAQLGIAHVTEQLLPDRDHYTPADLAAIAPTINPDLDRALELDPGNELIEAWKLMMDVNVTIFSGGNADDKIEAVLALYDRDPGFVVGTLVPPTASLPMNSGWPDRMADLVEEFDASPAGRGACLADECPPPSWPHAPYALPGSAFTYAEVMARVGRAERARAFLERALNYPESATWAHRSRAEDALENLDEWVARFDVLGPEQTAFSSMVVNGEVACVLCHGGSR